MNSKFLLKALAVVMWIFSNLFVGLIGFMGRGSFVLTTMLISKNAYLPRFLDKVFIVSFGIFWLGSWIFLEQYYQEGVEDKELLPRFMRVTGIELVVAFVAQVISTYYNTQPQQQLIQAILIAVALVLGIFLILSSNKMFKEIRRKKGRWVRRTHSA